MAQSFTEYNEYEIPSMEQIEIRAKEKNLVHVDLIDFFNFNSRMNWKSMNGSRIRDWRSLLEAWDRNAVRQGKPVWKDPRSITITKPERKSDPEPELSPEEREELIADIERLKAINQKQIDDYRPELLRKAGLMNQEEQRRN